MKTIKNKKDIAKTLDFNIHIKDGGVINLKSLTPKVTRIIDNRGSNESPTPVDPSNGHPYIDLGISVGGNKILFAPMNLGASTPEEYGDYYAWGETQTKESYSWSTYKWCKGSYDSLTKYNTKSSYDTVDNKTVLDLDDDVAHVKLGGNWRMPTDEEWTELGNQCTWTWTTQNGVNGRLVTSENGNRIFLPAAGYRDNTDLNDAGSWGNYWSSSLSEDDPIYAYRFYFDSSDVDWDYNDRCYGFTVRPVLVIPE